MTHSADVAGSPGQAEASAIDEMHDADVYQLLARRTKSKTLNHQMTMFNMAMGIASEAGEINEALKKHFFHGHNLDVENLKDELGDLLWYLTIMADEMGWDLSTVMTRNIDKLRKRYPEGFSQWASRNRNVEGEKA